MTRDGTPLLDVRVNKSSLKLLNARTKNGDNLVCWAMHFSPQFLTKCVCLILLIMRVDRAN